MEDTKNLQETKELKIIVPDGYEIDRENSTLECIRFKPIQSKFSDYDGTYLMAGWGIADDKTVYRRPAKNCKFTKDTFATEELAKSALAMAQISQIITHDKRFGGFITHEEWGDESVRKYTIERSSRGIYVHIRYEWYVFLAFHTQEQRALFLEENEDLVKQYLMID